MGVKGGASPAHAALHLKPPLRRQKDKSKANSIASPVAMGKGRNGRWKMSLEAAVSILHTGGSGHWSSGVELESTASPGSILNDQAAFFKDALLAPHGEGPRKGGLKKARLFRHPVGLPRPTGIFTCGQKPKQKLKTKKFYVACWNVRTLLDLPNSNCPERRSALVAQELSRLNIDIAALSEVRFSDEGSLKESGGGYTLYWSGKPATEKHQSGVAFMVRNSIAS